jgi:hypothetical protein
MIEKQLPERIALDPIIVTDRIRSRQEKNKCGQETISERWTQLLCSSYTKEEVVGT